MGETLADGANLEAAQRAIRVGIYEMSMTSVLYRDSILIWDVEMKDWESPYQE